MTSMIKGIIEKIIMTTFGKFIKGIQKDKLSIDLFSGNFKLENISFNHEFFDNLNTPFSLVYSSIGKLNLQAPISKLSSVPVECILDNIFVIFQFKQTISDSGKSFKARKDNILKEVKEVLESTLKKIKQQKKQDGMMAKLGKKIIDNLIMKIKNVHLRFEQRNNPKGYAFGLTLQQISLTTTDNQWKPTFIQRKPESQEQLFKMMQVNKLNLYWQSGSNLHNSTMIMSNELSDKERKVKLSQLIQQDRQVVISITSKFKLIINPPEVTQSALYQLEVGLQPLKFQLKRLQIQQMMSFAKKNVMQNENIVKSLSKKSKVKLAQEQKGRLREQYQDLIALYLQNYQQNIQLNNDLIQHQGKLQQIFEKVEENQLKIWALGSIKKKVQIIRQMQLKKKKGGWFNRGNTQLTQQQQEQLKLFIDQSFQSDISVRSSTCLFFKIKTQLKGGQMLLIQNKGTQIQEIIQFNIGKISAQIEKSQDKSYFNSSLEIQSINLNLYLSIQRQNQAKKKKMEIFTSQKPTQYKDESDEDSMQSFDSAQEEEQERPSFLKMRYTNQLFKEKGILKKTIDGNIQRLTVIYKKIYMQKFRKFFSFKEKQSFVKNNIELNDKIQQKFQNIEQAQEVDQESFKLQKQTDVKLKVNSPVFICPLNERQCWCLNLGRLKIISNRSEDCHQYPMIIESAFLRYYPFMKECLDLNKKKQGKGIFSLINDMDFKVNYQKFQKIHEQILSVQLPSFKVNFTQSQYRNLISLTKIFQVQQEQKRSMVQILKEQRKIIDENKTYESPILKKHQTLMSWRQFHGIISGSYLYLYNNRQQLKENSKIYLKNAKIQLKASQVDMDEDSYQLQITNQNQICYLSCHQTTQLLRWKIQLQNKCSSFKTIHEMMKQYEQMEIRSGKKRGASQTLNLSTNFKRKILKFQVSEVNFRYQNQHQDTLLQFQMIGINFSRQNMQNWSQKQFSMKKLIITDKIFKFKNPCYQTLIQAKLVSFQELRGKKNNLGSRQANITLNIQDLYINWKPDVLLMLIRLASQHFKKQQNYRLDDDIQQSRQQHFKQSYSDTKFMFFKNSYDEKCKNIKVKQNRDQLSLKASWMKQIMRININFNKFQINLIHRQSHLVMIKLISNNIDCSFCVTETAKFVSGYVNQLDIYDMTGYPQKQYSTHEEHQPYRIMTKKANNNTPLIHYRWSSYDANSFPNEQHVDSFIWVQITPLQYEYYQQITFRMIDYFLIQIILLINQPEMLTVNENLMQQLKNQQMIKGQKPIKILFSRYDEIIKKLIHPFFMDIYCQVKDISLILKAQKSSHIYHQMIINNLQFYNHINKQHKRFPNADQKLKNFIFQQEYIIRGDDCHFLEVSLKKQTRQSLFEPFKLQVNFNKLLFQDEINILYPELYDYDRSFLTINKISNIIISHYSRLQYLNINKLVNFNFTFDDQNDQMFIHNFKITKLLSPKPLLYHLVIPELHMTADYNAKEHSDQIWKLFKATIHKFTYIYRRNKQLNSSMEITLGLTQFKGFQYEQNKAEPNEIYLMTLGQLENNSTQIVIENRTSGQKLIQMSVNQLNINVRTGLLQLIFQYTLIEDWVFPTINKVTPQLIFHANIHKMNASLNEDSKLIAGELKKKNVSSKIIDNILSQKIDFASFRLQGLVCYKFYRKKDLTLQEYQKKLAKGQMKFQDFQKKQDEMSSMKLIMNTEIYRGWTNSSSKRKIIEKFSFHMQDKRFLRVADLHKHTIKTIAKRTMNIDRCFMKISFKDVILMRKILDQINQERKYIAYLNEKTGKAISQNNSQKQTELSSLQNLQLNVESISFYLINSRRDIFIPILKINMAAINLTKTLTYKKDILKSDFSITVFYFNSKIFKWQPILQTVSLGLHRIVYFGQNHSTFGSFQSTGPLLVNLSRQVFMSLKQTSDSWKKQSEQQQKKYIIKQVQIQPLQFISHYIIRNEIGYPIEIINNKLQLIKKINHNEQIDYQLELSNYHEEIDQIQIFIGFRILHPKYQFSEISNISFNSQKQYHFQPRIKGKNNNSIINLHSKIIIKPQVINSKKVLMIKSCKYVYNYYDGQCQIKALPFDHDTFYILPKAIHNQLKVSLYQQKSTDYYRYIGKNGILKIMQKNLVYNYSPIPLQICGKMVQPNQYIGISQKLRIQDKNYKDSIMKVLKNEKLKEYYIFSQCYLIDYYGLYFQFEKDNKDIQKLYSYKFYNNNQTPHFLYILPDTEFKFKAKTKNNNKCSTSSLKTTIGKSHFILEDDGKAQCHFTINSYLTPLQNVHVNQFVRVIEITPKYMLSNATKTLVKICQIQSCDSITLNPYERVPFFWQNKHKGKYIKLSSYDGQNFWGYSGELSIQKSTQTIVLRKSSDPKQYKIFTLQMQVTNTVIFLHIIEPSPKYLLSNKIPGTIMQVYQKAILDEKLDLQYSFPVQFFFIVKHNQEKAFGYQLPEQSRVLSIKIGFEVQNKEYNGLSCDEIEVDEIEINLWVKKVALRDQKKIPRKYIYLSLKFQNNIKKLMITNNIQEQQLQNSYEFIVKIPFFGLSFVGFHNEIRKQIFHIMLNEIEVQFFGNSDSNDIDLRISKCRIENELKYYAFFPIIFQSLKTQSAQKKFIHFKISRSAKNTRLIYYIGCSINRSELNITSEELQVIQENISKMNFYDQQTKQVVIRKCQMFNSTLPDPEESIYFVQAVIYPLKVVVTFKHVNQWGGKLLKTISSLSQCPISAQGQQLRHFTCLNFSMFFKLLLKHYQDGLAKMILSTIGNLTILGSPVTLVQKIGSGFKDLVELPVNQFENGPLQVGKGALKGTASLVSNTISGAFNTVQSITGSIGNGISVLVDGDRSFVRDRENIKNEKSQHLIGGLANGAKSIAYGFKNGLSGVFTEPVKGVQKHGLPGFFLGVGKGLGGLILKPISGVIDAASKTAEGIKNTPQFFNSEKQERYIRLHNPRPFYNYNKQFRNYDNQFANLIKIVYEQNRQKYDNLSWCSYYHLINKSEKSKVILLLSYQYIFFYDIKRNKMLNIVDSSSLTGVSLKEEQGQGIIKLNIYESKRKQEGFINISPDGGCRKLASELSTIIRHYSPNFKFC